MDSTILEKLQEIRNQADNVFIGTIISEQSLASYARFKYLLGYNYGLSYRSLNKINFCIEQIKELYPDIYNEFRKELFKKINIVLTFEEYHPKYHVSKESYIFNMCSLYIVIIDRIKLPPSREDCEEELESFKNATYLFG